jgi:protein-tyrosine-phosphatase
METFSIAFVCTGNRFRSPLAEAFVRRLTLGLPVETVSFVTLELEQAPPLDEALEIALWCGIDSPRAVRSARRRDSWPKPVRPKTRCHGRPFGRPSASI